MADSTTLMTFLVRAPPMTRSVTLWGSWDNFSKSYPMKRDGRVGPEHWTGCHRFENIICDGNASATSPPREGGLRMGGTYYYFVCIRCPSKIRLLTSYQSTSLMMTSNSITPQKHRPPRARCYLVSWSMFCMFQSTSAGPVRGTIV